MLVAPWHPFVGSVCYEWPSSRHVSLPSRIVVLSMFTGLIQHQGVVAGAEESAGEVRRLRVCLAGWSHRPAMGDSIAVDGCCLTVAGLEDEHVAFDVVVQTLQMSTLGELKVGDSVNLEHAATLGTLMGGHLVQGHIDGVGEVVQVAGETGDVRVRIAFNPAQSSLLMSQGSITVAGVSLTVSALGNDWFEVALIPRTLADTTLGDLVSGSRVNLEFDCIARMVQRQLASPTS
ncbi:MAG: riboflavin synthase [Phycisphaerales bacterium]|nr:riboflavin synthase [Phycisphaerales bacterium]